MYYYMNYYKANSSLRIPGSALATNYHTLLTFSNTSAALRLCLASTNFACPNGKQIKFDCSCLNFITTFGFHCVLVFRVTYTQSGGAR